MITQQKYTRQTLEAVGAFKKTLDDHRFVGDVVYKIVGNYGIPRNTLQVVFKELYGLNIRKYKLKVRMERGRDLLRQGMSVKRVSILLHYTTARAFVTAFKKHFGVSPGRWSGSRKP